MARADRTVSPGHFSLLFQKFLCAAKWLKSAIYVIKSERSAGAFTKDDGLMATFVGIATKICYAPLNQQTREGQKYSSLGVFLCVFVAHFNG
jgi:hypothetical protein